MKTLRHLFSLLIIAFISISAQEKLLTVEDAIMGAFRYAPSNVRMLNWIPETDNYVFAEGNGEQSVLLVASVKSN
ncbi:MAG: hypothetical protein GYA14_15055, partial [Ignavibacteria bacterium]|nr:hypothetical protein [Ignavibacteria bacterium]